MKIKRKFRCRIEEVTVIGGFVYDSFLLDKKDFTDYSEPEFSGSFADDYKKEMKEIDELIAPKNITRKMKVVTSHLYKTISDFRKPLNALEGYVNMAAKKSSSSAPGASSLTVLPTDFGIQTMRQALANHDTDEILGSFQTLLQNINHTRQADEYTITSLINRIRQERKKQKTTQPKLKRNGDNRDLPSVPPRRSSA